jgi:hypothetical protein
MFEDHTGVFTRQEFKPSKSANRVAAGNTSVDDRFIALGQLETSILRAQFERITSFADLGPGWNQGVGARITPAARLEAMRFVRDALTETTILSLASPLETGGIMLEWQLADRDLVIEIMPDGRSEFLLSVGDDFCEEGPVTLIAPYIRRLHEALLAGSR